jgi:hypothetical protein
MMQKLTCSVCSHTWEREPQRGRPPTKCADCRAGRAPTIVAAPKPAPKAKPTRKRKSKWEQLPVGLQADIAEQPLSGRASGWCTTYYPAPAAQHEKCDGDLGKTRCNCPDNCHGWS